MTGSGMVCSCLHVVVGIINLQHNFQMFFVY